MWYLRVCLKIGDHTPQKIRFMEELDDWQYFCLGGCLIFRNSHLSSPKNEGCSKNARIFLINERCDSRYLLSMTCVLLAGKFLFTTSYETRFMNHGLKFVLAVLRDGILIVKRVTPLDLDHDQEKKGSATWNIYSNPCNPRFLYFRWE